ncbi:hypothetical protein EIP91_006736 [Steccherinum ochraceum]|uniref:Cytochrome P450-dit2 n=1 Tax=Steccherinum ochraceum TaxID=92696 RepID=A0A4R0RFV9_9APHY|nr:hypothetical protein EIP91_006736 [Steccherinum ochraceum]
MNIVLASPSSEPRWVYVVAALAAWFTIVNLAKSQRRKLSHIPSLTVDLPLLSYIGSLQYLLSARTLLQRGYDKYKGKAFKVPEFFRWHVFISGKTLVEELRKANDDELNFMEAMNEVLHMDYTFGNEAHNNPYHIPIIRTSLTRNLGVLYPEVRDELVTASNELIPPSDDWTKVQAFPTIMKIVCRTSNRIFVGLPLCRNEEFLKINMGYTLEIVKAGLMVGAVPSFMRGLAAQMTSVAPMTKRSEDILRPIIEERVRSIDEHGGDWDDKPNDMISWLIDAAPKGADLVPSVALRVLITNFAAIHTSTMTFSHVLYHLAAYPEYQSELREEVDRVVARHGWTKDSLAKMIKTDSFIKEIARFQGLGTTSLTRLAMKDFTFSDGTFIPKGTLVSATSRAAHFDEENYENADIFDPWRFAKMEAADGTESLRNQIVNTHPEFLTFGLGKHACPGRFFASTELKSLLANFVYTYDMKMEQEGVVPPTTWEKADLGVASVVVWVEC